MNGKEEEIYNIINEKKEIDDKTPNLRTEDEKCCKKKPKEIHVPVSTVWTPPDILDTPPALPAHPVHQVQIQPPHFPPPVPTWDKEDITEDPIVVGACTGTNDQEVLPESPAMKDVMDTLQSSEEEDDNLDKRNNLGERLRRMKKRPVEMGKASLILNYSIRCCTYFAIFYILHYSMNALKNLMLA